MTCWDISKTQESHVKWRPFWVLSDSSLRQIFVAPQVTMRVCAASFIDSLPTGRPLEMDSCALVSLEVCYTMCIF